MKRPITFRVMYCFGKYSFSGENCYFPSTASFLAKSSPSVTYDIELLGKGAVSPRINLYSPTHTSEPKYRTKHI